MLALGGFGGASGNGGKVTVDNDAVLQTFGDHAIGILAQSIGGGGGNGGGTGLSVIAVGGYAGVLGSTGNGGPTGPKVIAVSVTNSADAVILTQGVGAYGIEAQSVGGGGGNGGGNSEAAAVTVGGEAGSAGNGERVQVVNDGRLIQTMGDNAIGIVAQSIGGSGGAGGGSFLSLIAVGGSGGSGGAGGEVDVTNNGIIVTGSAANGTGTAPTPYSRNRSARAAASAAAPAGRIPLRSRSSM